MKGLPSILLSALLLFAVSTLTAETTKRAITPEDIVSIRGVDDPQISPNGRLVAFTVYEPADTAGGDGYRNPDIWIVNTNGKPEPQKFIFGTKQELMPRWSPDGRTLAFLSNRSADGTFQVYTIPAYGGEASVLTDVKAGVSAFKWEPDSQAVSFITQDTLTAEEAKHNAIKHDDQVIGAGTKHARMYRIDLKSHDLNLLSPENESVIDFDYSPDGSRIVLQVAPSPAPDDSYYRSKLVIMNRDGSKGTILSEKTAGYCKWSPDGTHLIHFLYAGQAEALVPELLDLSGERAPAMADDYYGAVYEMKWSPDGRSVLISSHEGTQGIIGILDPKKGTVKPIRAVGHPWWSYSNFSVDAGGKWLAFADASYQSAVDIWLMRIDGSGARQLTNLNPQVAQFDFGTAELLRWKSPDGEQIEGVLVKPSNYQEGHTYPLVVQVHGGPAWAWWTGWLGDWFTWAPLLANHGCMVLMPNPRGSACCGWRFANKSYCDWAGGDFQDIMSGVDYLIAAGLADSNRLAIGGWSYGGYLTQWAVTQTDRFKAAVTLSGLSDLESFYGTTDTPTLMRWYFADHPFGNDRIHQLYHDRSPISFVMNVRTPTLILHGEKDVRVPISQSYQFYQGLKDMGVEVSYVVYPRESHAIGESAHQTDLMHRVLDWYREHLGLSPPM